MDRALKWFVIGWTTFVVLFNLVAIAGLMMSANGVWTGVRAVAEIYSPFNVINMVAEVVLLSPAIAAFIWRNRRRRRLA